MTHNATANVQLVLPYTIANFRPPDTFILEEEVCNCYLDE